MVSVSTNCRSTMSIFGVVSTVLVGINSTEHLAEIWRCGQLRGSTDGAGGSKGLVANWYEQNRTD